MPMCRDVGESFTAGTGSGDLGYQRIGQAGLGFSCTREAFAQVGAEAAEFFDAGDDAVLFGEGWKRNNRCPNLSNV